MACLKPGLGFRAEFVAGVAGDESLDAGQGLGLDLLALWLYKPLRWMDAFQGWAWAPVRNLFQTASMSPMAWAKFTSCFPATTTTPLTLRNAPAAPVLPTHDEEAAAEADDAVQEAVRNLPHNFPGRFVVQPCSQEE